MNERALLTATTVVDATVVLACPQLSDELFGQAPTKKAKKPPGFVLVAVALINTAVAPGAVAAGRSS